MLWTILFCIQFKSLSFSFAYKVVSWDDEHYTYQVISESRGKCLFIFFLKKHVSEKHLPGTQLRSVKKTRLKTTRMRFDDERNGWLLVERCFIHYSCGPRGRSLRRLSSLGLLVLFYNPHPHKRCQHLLCLAETFLLNSQT